MAGCNRADGVQAAEAACEPVCAGGAAAPAGAIGAACAVDGASKSASATVASAEAAPMPSGAGAQNPLLEFDGVSIEYAGIPVVHNVSLSVCAGDSLGIAGESGSGKSTLLLAAMGLLGSGGRVCAGRILFRGVDMASMTPAELRRLRGAEVGMVFQDCLASFAPTRTLGSQLEESLVAHDCCRPGWEGRACELLSRFGIADPAQVLDSYPFQLSGGMGQRAGIAFALMLRPSVLLADEPTSALDAVSQKMVVEELARLCREQGTALVVVSHNMAVIKRLAARVAILKSGEVVESGAVAKVFGAPEHPYTRQLLAAVPVLERGAH